VTALGIISVTSYGRRPEQRGRSAFAGARRPRKAIVRYFQTRISLIAAAGAAIGIAFDIA